MKTDAPTPAERAAAVARAADAAAARRQRPGERLPGGGGAARLLAATTELEAQVARARAQLEPLDAALRKIAMPGGPPG